MNIRDEKPIGKWASGMTNGNASKPMTGSPLKSQPECSHSPCAWPQVVWLCPVKISEPYLQNWGRKPIFGHRNQNFFKMNIRGDRFDREMSIRGSKPMIFFWIWGLSLTPPNPPIFLRYGHQNFFGQSPVPMESAGKGWGRIEPPWAELLDQTRGHNSLGHTVYIYNVYTNVQAGEPVKVRCVLMPPK